MRSIRTTNNNRRRIARNVAGRVRRERDLEAIVLALLEDDEDVQSDEECGQCDGTGTIQGGLSGDRDDEECPVCDGTGTLNGVTNGCW